MRKLSSLNTLCVAGLCAISSVLPVSVSAGGQIDQLIIRYHDDVQARMAKSSKASDPQFMARMAEHYVAKATGLQVSYKRAMSAKTGAHVLRLPYAMDVEQARMYAGQLMENQPDIDYAEPDYRRYPMRTMPNDPQVNRQWHLMSPADFAGAANVVNAWDLTKGSADIVVAVLDEGMTNHVDLQSNLVGGSAAKSGYDMVGDDPAGDGDGRDSDPSNPGASVSSNEDSAWHGTVVGGLIAARPDNNKFVAGVGWNTRLAAVRILSESGGYLSDQVDGMLWAGGEKVPGVPNNKNPALILNMSIGTDSFETCSRTEQNAVDVLTKKGVSIVVAAGNENRNVEDSAPANCTGVISVSGVTKEGARAPFANYGELNDIAAPASDIFSTFNTGKRAPGSDTAKADSGTSQSAPQVAGVLALMLAANDKLLDENIVPKAELTQFLEKKLKQSARPFPEGAGDSDDPKGCNPDSEKSCVCTTATCGAGLLDALRAVKSVSTAPEARTGSNRNVDAQTVITLDGSSSTDDAYGGRITAYQWQQVSGPDVILSGADKAKATFTAPGAKKRSDTQLVFELTVTDDVGLKDSKQVVITVPDKGGGGNFPVSLLFLLGIAGLYRLKHSV